VRDLARILVAAAHHRLTWRSSAIDVPSVAVLTPMAHSVRCGSANSQKTRTYQLGFKCSYPRRYRFTVLNGGNPKTVSKPSSTGQTTSVNLTVTINF